MFDNLGWIDADNGRRNVFHFQSVNYAVIERSAFSPIMFHGATPLSFTEPSLEDRGTSIAPAVLGALLEAVRCGSDETTRLTDWWHWYDYVYYFSTRPLPAELARYLTPRHRGPFFQLFETVDRPCRQE